MKNIEVAFTQMKERGWDRLYWVIDLHGTIIPTSYDAKTGYSENEKTFFPYAKDVLKFLTMRSDMILVLWTSSYDKDIGPILDWLKENNIKFDYVNENPEVINQPHAQFNSGKFYFNILIDDKANFDPNRDWKRVLSTLINIGEIPSANYEPADMFSIFARTFFGVEA